MQPSCCAAGAGRTKPIAGTPQRAACALQSRVLGASFPIHGANARSLGTSRRPSVPARYSTVAALLAQSVEHLHGKEGVVGSSPTEGFVCYLRLPGGALGSVALAARTS